MQVWLAERHATVSEGLLSPQWAVLLPPNGP